MDQRVTDKSPFPRHHLPNQNDSTFSQDSLILPDVEGYAKQVVKYSHEKSAEETALSLAFRLWPC